MAPNRLLEPADAQRVSRALTRAGAGNPLLTFAPDAGHSAAAFPDAVPGLVAGITRWLGVRERRVAASLVVLGYAARLVGPTVAVLLRENLLIEARPAHVRFDFAAGRGLRLALAVPAGWTGPADALAQRWREQVLDDHLSMVVAAVRRHTPLAVPLLWGNVASGVFGALAALHRDGAVPLPRCTGFGAAVLADGPLAGAGTFVAADDALRFTRRTCCLYYRLPGGGYCGDCCLTRPRKALP